MWQAQVPVRSLTIRSLRLGHSLWDLGPRFPPSTWTRCCPGSFVTELSELACGIKTWQPVTNPSERKKAHGFLHVEAKHVSQGYSPIPRTCPGTTQCSLIWHSPQEHWSCGYHG